MNKKTDEGDKDSKPDAADVPTTTAPAADPAAALTTELVADPTAAERQEWGRGQEAARQERKEREEREERLAEEAAQEAQEQATRQATLKPRWLLPF